MAEGPDEEFSGTTVETRSGEVHFKRRHLPDRPSGRNLEWPPNNNDGYENCQIIFDRFCHDTHRREYGEIRPQENGPFTMIPRMKTGKETYLYYGQLNGATYTPIRAHAQEGITGDTRYRRIETDEEVLPGYYSWWGIHNTDNPVTPDDITVSDEFSNRPTSWYGSKRISTSSLQLLQSYQDGLVDIGGRKPRLQFRNGGTLRYKLEICYVVIVCDAEGHFNGADDDYPVIEDGPGSVIPTNIQYDDNTGRIISMGEWSVTIRNGVKTKRKDKHKFIPYWSYSWDHYAFAFHYPAEDYKLVLPPAHVKVDDVKHTFCIKKENIDGSLKCPDQIDH